MSTMTPSLDRSWRMYGHGLTLWLAAQAARANRNGRAFRPTCAAPDSNHMRRDIGLAEREKAQNPLRFATCF